MNVYLGSEWRHQSQLIEERERLRDLLGRLRSAATDRTEFEPYDVIDDEVALQADAIEARLVVVMAALDRIEADEYGLCLSCRSEIGDERLDVLPATEMCRICAVSEGHGVAAISRS